jgi:hypothetical protein
MQIVSPPAIQHAVHREQVSDAAKNLCNKP